MLLVDLNYNFECDWFVKLQLWMWLVCWTADNKLFDNNLASELVGFFKPITIEEIVIFMINIERLWWFWILGWDEIFFWYPVRLCVLIGNPQS